MNGRHDCQLWPDCKCGGHCECEPAGSRFSDIAGKIAARIVIYSVLGGVSVAIGYGLGWLVMKATAAV